MILLCNENSEVILSNPGYACYKNFVLGAHAKPVNVPLRAENGFQYKVEDIKEKITEKYGADYYENRFYKSKIDFGLITFNKTNKKPKILQKKDI